MTDPRLDELANEVASATEARCELLQRVKGDLPARITEIGLRAAQVLEASHTIFTMGNGGSAAQAQHLAAELVGRFKVDRPALRSTALTADSTLLTAIGNDYGFETIFQRQVQAHVTSGDMLIAFSTSGKSPNVIAACREARRRGAVTVGLTGGTGGDLLKEVDLAFVVPSPETAEIQEVHLVVCHLLCAVIERCLRGSGDA